MSLGTCYRTLRAFRVFRAPVRIGGLCQASGTKHISQPFNLQAPICILPRHYQPTPPSTAKLPPVIPSEAGRRSFFPVRSCEPVGLRREESLFYLPSSASTRIRLLSRFTRKCACQRNRGYVTCWAARFIRIVSEVFLNYTHGLDGRHSMGHAGHPVPSRDTEQLLMHREAICEAFNPAQTRSITPNAGRVAGRVSRPFTVYAPSTAYA